MPTGLIPKSVLSSRCVLVNVSARICRPTPRQDLPLSPLYTLSSQKLLKLSATMFTRSTAEPLACSITVTNVSELKVCLLAQKHDVRVARGTYFCNDFACLFQN